MNRSLLNINNISITFPDKNKRNLEVVNKFNLNVCEGMRTAIIGPSGCGKSSILKSIVGLIPLSGGDISFGGLSSKEARQKGLFGYVPQQGALLNWKNVASNVSVPLEVRKMKVVNYKNDICRIINSMGLQGFENYFPRQLSGGMKSRVAIARAMINSPRVLLLDECFAGVDELTRERLYIELSKKWNLLKTTLILVTHSIREAIYLADRIIILSSRPAVILREIKNPAWQPRDIGYMKSQQFTDLLIEVRSCLGL